MGKETRKEIIKGEASRELKAASGIAARSSLVKGWKELEEGLCSRLALNEADYLIFDN